MHSTETEELVEVVLPGKVEPEGLRIRRGAVPAPGPGQVVIRMEATGVSFAEQQMRRGKYFDQPPFPFVPGYDLVGTVAATGEGVAPALTGTRVAAMVKIGGWASHVVVDAADAVPVPDGVDAATLIAEVEKTGYTAQVPRAEAPTADEDADADADDPELTALPLPSEDDEPAEGDGG